MVRLPQHEITLSALYHLYNGGKGPEIFYTNEGWILNNELYTIKRNLIHFLNDDEVELLNCVFLENSRSYTIFGDDVIEVSKIEQETLGTTGSFAFHHLATFATKEIAELALSLIEKVHQLVTQNEPKRDHVKIQMIKDHPDAKPPRTAYAGTSAAFDLASVETIEIPAFTDAVVPVGLRLSIDEKDPYYMTVHMRSSLGFKKGVQCHVGIIDAGYCGDFGIKVFNRTAFPLTIQKGDYFAQVLVHKKPQIEFVELNNEEWKEYENQQQRGSGGFGSSGK